MLFCVIHDKIFATLNEFETHIEEHQTKRKEIVEQKEMPKEPVIVQGE